MLTQSDFKIFTARHFQEDLGQNEDWPCFPFHFGNLAGAMFVTQNMCSSERQPDRFLTFRTKYIVTISIVFFAWVEIMAPQQTHAYRHGCMECFLREAKHKLENFKQRHEKTANCLERSPIIDNQVIVIQNREFHLDNTL